VKTGGTSSSKERDIEVSDSIVMNLLELLGRVMVVVGAGWSKIKAFFMFFSMTVVEMFSKLGTAWLEIECREI